METISILTISGDIIQYDGVIDIEYNGSSIIYVLSGGESHEIKIKNIKSFTVI